MLLCVVTCQVDGKFSNVMYSSVNKNRDSKKLKSTDCLSTLMHKLNIKKEGIGKSKHIAQNSAGNA